MPLDQAPDPRAGHDHSREDQGEQSPGLSADGLVQLESEPCAESDGYRDHDPYLAEDRRALQRAPPRVRTAAKTMSVYGRYRGSASGARAGTRGSVWPLPSLEPAAALEVKGEQAGRGGHEGHRQPEELRRLERDRGEVHAEEAGHQG